MGFVFECQIKVDFFFPQIRVNKKLTSLKNLITLYLQLLKGIPKTKIPQSQDCGILLPSGSSQNRTDDTRIFNPLLYRLSYQTRGTGRM